MNRKEIYNDFLLELGDAFDFYLVDDGRWSTVGDPCFMTNDVGNDIVTELTEHNFSDIMVFLNNFSI